MSRCLVVINFCIRGAVRRRYASLRLQWKLEHPPETIEVTTTEEGDATQDACERV